MVLNPSLILNTPTQPHIKSVDHNVFGRFDIGDIGGGGGVEGLL